MLRDEEWQEKDGLILRNRKMYVPKDKKLRVEIIQLYHDILVGEHRRQQKMTELVTRNFWQPGIIKEIKKYIEECNAYQRNKNGTKTLVEKLMPNVVLEKLQTYVIADFITKLLLVQEYDSILVVYDRLTKIVHFMSTMEKTLAERVVRLFWDNIQKLYSLPESIITNGEVQFVVGMMKKLNNILGIDTKLLMVYYLQINKQTKRMNQDLEQYLRMFINHRQE